MNFYGEFGKKLNANNEKLKQIEFNFAVDLT